MNNVPCTLHNQNLIFLSKLLHQSFLMSGKMEFKCVNLEENIHSKSRQVKCERCTHSSSSCSAHISSTKELTDAIELTWHRHLELRNELYELEMGPSDVLEVYLSCQKTVRSSMTKDELTELMVSNYKHHLQLKTMYYKLKGISCTSTKNMYM